ncbi:MAG: GNAT family N-acetyltransferase [Hyphomicrobiaceae bacterium]
MLRRIRRSNLLQHYAYAQATRATRQLGARHGIIHIDGEPAGLVQLGEVGLFWRLIHAVTLDRGPLWLDGFGAPGHVAAFFGEIARQFPRRLGRKRRILPELPDTEVNRTMLARQGFVRNPAVEGYETLWVDLTAPIPELRANLAGKWRNALSKAERNAVAVVEDRDLATRAAFLAAYEADRIEKQYAGPTARMLATLIDFMAPRREAILLIANGEKGQIAAVLILVHGTSATYQAGWTTGGGRKQGAHHRLLWLAMLLLKDRGVTDLDLGGVNDDSAAGVKRFKEGLGGETRRLVGLYG